MAATADFTVKVLPAMDEIRLLRHVLRDRERELLALKGPCRDKQCSLHYAHYGPCNITT
ncbi:MAG TPA: hypothetical protein VJQ80_14275 [Arthrobacter sp.]|nr:hypothetical protein [Arthrobacter sp.]